MTSRANLKKRTWTESAKKSFSSTTSDVAEEGSAESEKTESQKAESENTESENTEFKNTESESVESEHTESEKVESPLEPRCLPHRETRGRRLRALAGDDAELDEEFWKLQTWQESDSDQEWFPGEEDQAYTSTSCSSSISDASGLDDSENSSEHVDARLLKEEQELMRKAAAKKRQQVYKDPKSQRRQSTWQMSCSRRPLSSRSSRAKTDTHRASRPITTFVCDAQSQEEHLRMAESAEKINTKQFTERLELGNWKRLVKEQKESSMRWTGSMELLIFWASDRLLYQYKKEKDEEENEQKTCSISEDGQSPPRFCHQLLFFVDYDNPIKTALPAMYCNQSNSADPQANNLDQGEGKYKDPLTGKVFSDLASFRDLREREDLLNERFLRQCFSPVEEKLKKVLGYMREHQLFEQFSGVEAASGHVEMTEKIGQYSFSTTEKCEASLTSSEPWDSLKPCSKDIRTDHEYKEEELVVPTLNDAHTVNETTPLTAQEKKKSIPVIEENIRAKSPLTSLNETKSRLNILRKTGKTQVESLSLKKSKGEVSLESFQTEPALLSERQPLRIHSTTNHYTAPCISANPLPVSESLNSLGLPCNDPVYYPCVPLPHQCSYPKQQYGPPQSYSNTMLTPTYESFNPYLAQNMMCVFPPGSMTYPPTSSFVQQMMPPFHFLPAVNPYMIRVPIGFPVNFSPVYPDTQGISSSSPLPQFPLGSMTYPTPEESQRPDVLSKSRPPSSSSSQFGSTTFPYASS